MKRLLLITFFALFSSILLGNPLVAQELDTVWRVDYEEWIEDRAGKKFLLDTASLLFDKNVAWRKIDSERTMVIRGDSIYMINDFRKVVSIGPHQFVNMSWIVNPVLVWKRRRIGGFRLNDTDNQETIASYPAREKELQFLSNGRMLPYIRHLMLTDEAPFSSESLKNFYLLFALFDVDISTDLVAANDTLHSRHLFPLQIRTGSYLPNDTTGITVMRAVSIRREGVPKSKFEWPADYFESRFRVPTETELWELTGIPMPGGPKD